MRNGVLSQRKKAVKKEITLIAMACVLTLANAKIQAAEQTESYEIQDFEVIYQMPELPTGCEITAMTMAMNYYGADVDKTTMAGEYLPKLESTDIHYGEDGKKYGADLRNYFIGDPFSQHGYVAGASAIVTAANYYFEDTDSDLRAVNTTGMDFEKMYEHIQKNEPVVVLTTIGMENRRVMEGWYLEDGVYVDWAKNDHGSVLIGYDEENVTIADPINGIVKYKKEQFEHVIEERGFQSALIVRTGTTK